MRILCFIFICLLALNITKTASAAGAIEQDFNYQGHERNYTIFIPKKLLNTQKKYPAIFVLHGGGGTAKNAERMTGFTQKAREQDFIVIYPNGAGRMDKLKTWNSWHCCGYALKQKSDDIGYISSLIDHVTATAPINPDKIFITGMSNGGMMTHRIGVELSDKIAGIAPVVAGLFVDTPTPAGSVPTLIINGFLDESFPMKGGQTNGRFKNSWDGTNLLPVKAQSKFWAIQNQCQKRPQTVTTETYWHIKYQCPQGQDVEHYILKDNGHAWPSGKKGSSLGDTPTTSMDATDVIWDFFKKL